MFEVDSVCIHYEQKCVVQNFSFQAEAGKVVSIIGPNGSGKSTVLKAMSKQIPLQSGTIKLEGTNIHKLSMKQMARTMCLLSQKNTAPTDMTVLELVAYGRTPFKKWYEKLNDTDWDIIHWAIEQTHLSDFKDRTVMSLSGGESQRAWIAMALAQRPKVLLLDEPTTYLDISHQHEVLELVRELNEQMKMTVIMVLHDLNQASTYSDEVVVISGGQKAMCGHPCQVMTTEMIKKVYRMHADIELRAESKSPRIHLLHTIKSKNNEVLEQ